MKDTATLVAMFSFGSLLSRKVSSLVIGTLIQPVDRPKWGGTKVPVCPSCEWDVMEVGFPGPVKHSDDHSLANILTAMSQKTVKLDSPAKLLLYF